MRQILGLVILVSTVTACSGDGDARRPFTTQLPVAPVIASKIPVAQRLPCPSQQRTTVDMEGCGIRRMSKADAAVDARVNALFALLGTVGFRDRANPERRRFVQKEREWLAFREALCSGESGAYRNALSPSLYVGGSMAPLVYGDCVVDLDSAHVRELERTISVVCELRVIRHSGRCPHRK